MPYTNTGIKKDTREQRGGQNFQFSRRLASTALHSRSVRPPNVLPRLVVRQGGWHLPLLIIIYGHKVTPRRVLLLYEQLFTMSREHFYLLLAFNSINDTAKLLHIHQLIKVVPLGKAFANFRSMLQYTPLQVGGNACVENRISLVGKHIDITLPHTTKIMIF